MAPWHRTTGCLRPRDMEEERVETHQKALPLKTVCPSSLRRSLLTLFCLFPRQIKSNLIQLDLCGPSLRAVSQRAQQMPTDQHLDPTETCNQLKAKPKDPSTKPVNLYCLYKCLYCKPVGCRCFNDGNWCVSVFDCKWCMTIIDPAVYGYITMLTVLTGCLSAG